MRRHRNFNSFVSSTEELLSHDNHIEPVIKTSTKLDIDITNLKIYVTENDFFSAKFATITPTNIEFTNKEDVKRFTEKPLEFYQNQFNLAVYCATSASGISFEHLNHKIPLVQAVYRFHLYYQICKIFHFLEIPLPGETSFNSMKNNMNERKYNFLKEEFDIKDSQKFYIKGISFEKNNWPHDYDPNKTILDGYSTFSGLTYAYLFRKDWEEERKKLNEPYFVTFSIDKNKHVFDKLIQEKSSRYLHFIPLTSKNLTNAGIRRMNDSIRTYVYCILGAQAMVKHDIGSSLDAQYQFKILVEDAIQGQTLVDSLKTFQQTVQQSVLNKSIQSYEYALEKTNSRLDFVIGEHLQLIPSNMRLHIGKIIGYNNAITTAKSGMKIGKNNQINTVKPRLRDHPRDRVSLVASTGWSRQ